MWKMSDRARRVFGEYVSLRRAIAFSYPEEDAAEREHCQLLGARLDETFGHVEHEILVDQMEEAITDATRTRVALMGQS